jgi:hypothetical protein
MFIVLFLIAVSISLALFDVVLKKQYRDHPDAWKRDGCPWGFFSFPREVGFLPGCRARGAIFRQWTFANPDWSASDQTAIHYLRLFRFAVVAGLVFWVLGVLMMLKVI